MTPSHHNAPAACVAKPSVQSDVLRALERLEMLEKKAYDLKAKLAPVLPPEGPSVACLAQGKPSGSLRSDLGDQVSLLIEKILRVDDIILGMTQNVEL